MEFFQNCNKYTLIIMKDDVNFSKSSLSSEENIIKLNIVKNKLPI